MKSLPRLLITLIIGLTLTAIPAVADDTGSACGIITAAFTACAHGLGESTPVRHPRCESRGDDRCLWEVAPLQN